MRSSYSCVWRCKVWLALAASSLKAVEYFYTATSGCGQQTLTMAHLQHLTPAMRGMDGSAGLDACFVRTKSEETKGCQHRGTEDKLRVVGPTTAAALCCAPQILCKRQAQRSYSVPGFFLVQLAPVRQMLRSGAEHPASTLACLWQSRHCSMRVPR